MTYLSVAFRLLPVAWTSISSSIASTPRTPISGMKRAWSGLRVHQPFERIAALRARRFAPGTLRRAMTGFTLIELMIALTILAFLITEGLPSFTDFMRNSEIRSTTESIVNGLRLARSEAANRNQPVRFTLAGAGNPSWSISQVSDNSVIQSYSKQEGGVNTTVAIQPAQAVAVTFNGLGRLIPAAAGGNPNLQQLDITSALAASSRPLRIYIDDGHGIRVCDPSTGLAALVPHDARAC